MLVTLKPCASDEAAAALWPCRYDGWVTELQDPELMRRLDGSAYGLDNLLYSADACE